jgi:predicted CXXCH cytochrome family protein
MALRRNFVALGAVALVSLVGMTVAVSDIPQPDIPKGRGEQCVADTDFMRRNHMTMLQHQRDETMLQGVRSKQYSLKECVACHAVAGGDAMPVTVNDPKHFCRSCHDYAAVKIDCFQCHASRPDPDAVVAGVENE